MVEQKNQLVFSFSTVANIRMVKNVGSLKQTSPKICQKRATWHSKEGHTRRIHILLIPRNMYYMVEIWNSQANAILFRHQKSMVYFLLALIIKKIESVVAKNCEVVENSCKWYLAKVDLLPILQFALCHLYFDTFHRLSSLSNPSLLSTLCCKVFSVILGQLLASVHSTHTHSLQLQKCRPT